MTQPIFTRPSVRYITVTSLHRRYLHHRHVTVTSLLHHCHITVTSPSHYRHITCTRPSTPRPQASRRWRRRARRDCTATWAWQARCRFRPLHDGYTPSVSAVGSRRHSSRAEERQSQGWAAGNPRVAARGVSRCWERSTRAARAPVTVTRRRWWHGRRPVMQRCKGCDVTGKEQRCNGK